MNLQFVPETSPILLNPCEEFDFNNSPFDPKEFAYALHEKMVKNDGLGLSANQVGYSYRIFAIRAGDEPYVLFNPKIVDISERQISMKEGCLSFPLLFLNVKRPDAVRIRYQKYDGTTDTNQFIGMSARVCLHEYDHLEGKVFTQVASTFETQRAMRKRMILKRRVK
jgi:peptide deformylase